MAALTDQFIVPGTVAAAGPVLVTGAGGFVGANVVRALRAHGLSVRALVRRAPRGPVWEGVEGVEFVPGDRIVGIIEGDGRGLTVHTIDCERLEEFEDREELWRDLQWTPEAERNALARARLTATIRNAPGVLGQACTVIGESGGNIVGLRMHHRQQDFFDVDFDLEVNDARHLTHISAALRANPSVETVDRTKA